MPDHPSFQLYIHILFDMTKEVPCPVVGGDPNPLGLPSRQRVVFRIVSGMLLRGHLLRLSYVEVALKLVGFLPLYSPCNDHD